MNSDRDATAIASRDREDDSYIRRATGPRRDVGICYECGEPMPEPLFGERFCSLQCQDKAVRR